MGARRLSDSLWLIDTGSAYDCHVYVADGGTEAALIDCGTGLAAESLLRGIERTGCLDRLSHVFVTHYHADHAGGAVGVRAEGDVRVLASAAAVSALGAGDEDRTQVAAARAAGVYPADYRYPACPVDEVVADGDSRRVGDLVVTVHASPGHCDGHLCFLVEDGERRALCTGDAIFSGGRVSIQPIPDCSPYLYARTAQRLAELPVDMLLPGHLDLVLVDGAADLARAAESFRRLVPPPNIVTDTVPTPGEGGSERTGAHVDQVPRGPGGGRK
jgi:glyoxylase-like metal-dependent hydrolase (beta-lactamase superfamily II)